MTQGSEELLNGLVRSATGGAYEVEVHPGTARAEVVEASLRGRLKQEQRTGDAVVVGDRVRVVRHGDGHHTIEAVEPRTTQLARVAPGRRKARGGRGASRAGPTGPEGQPAGRRAKVMVANVDQLLVVVAAAHPAPNLRLVDRFLVLAESAGIEGAIVVNKTDLADDAELAAFDMYSDIGYRVLRTSAKAGAGLDGLRDALRGRISVLAGPSGVGKSSLLNAVQPGLSLRTADVSESVGKGRHTTVSARLIPLDIGGYVADTPGLRELGLWDVDDAELDLCFPEFLPHLDDCRFGRSCTHTHEPDCAIQQGVEGGRITRDRYDSYRALLES